MKKGFENKKILITGGAGGVGMFVSRKFAAEGYHVRVFDLPTPINKRVFKPGEPNIETFWGDITNPKDVREAMDGAGEVIHLAALVVPATEKNPALAKKVNVEGTKYVAEAAAAESKKAGRTLTIRFSSSATVYGPTNNETPPIPPDHPVNPTDNYTTTKVQAEEVIRTCGLPWTIYRFAAAQYLTLKKGSFGQMKIIPPDNRIEFVHILDIADAFINSVGNPETIEKTFILAGGPKCQMLYRDELKRSFDLLGFPEPNWKKFNTQPFNLDWYDTEESQRVLKFQSRTFDDYLKDFRVSLGFKYYPIRYLAGPAMRLFGIHL